TVRHFRHREYWIACYGDDRLAENTRAELSRPSRWLGPHMGRHDVPHPVPLSGLHQALDQGGIRVNAVVALFSSTMVALQSALETPKQRVHRMGNGPPVIKMNAHEMTRANAHMLPQHLRRLEAESIEIMRDVVAEFKRPVMLYSIGKDSSVMLHLAVKAFHPAKLPFPLLHVDTTWKFRDMIAFRDATARRLGLDLIVHVNQEGLARGINPIASGSSLHTQVMKTDALKQALDANQFDAAFGGARRDEEKSRAKERIFSFRSAGHGWD